MDDTTKVGDPATPQIFEVHSAAPVDRARLVEQIADAYNKSTPKQQRQLDLQLKQKQSALMANPHALFYLFPTLGKKPIKLKEPARG